MYPQSELENYKLQVELLQEKLQRSEERRQQLEEKFENIMKRRSEHERLMRAKSRFKYQQFLQEQSERNERNKSLIRALERIDQQAVALAARSERLKILKVQYELYFNKVLQFRGISSPPSNYNIFSHSQTIPIASHFNYSTDFNSRTAFTIPTAEDGNFESLPELDSYRHADSRLPEDTIVSTSDVAPYRRQQQEVNLMPNIKDVIATTTGISSPDPHNQSPLFADTRISIDSSRYKDEGLKPIDYRYDGDSGVIAQTKTAISISDRPQSSTGVKLVGNSNEIQGPGKSYSSNDNLKRESTVPSQGIKQPLSLEGSLASELQSQPFTLDKLPPINRDEALGKLLAKLYDDAIKKDGVEGEKSSEKSQPRCSIEGKNMSVIKGKIMDTMESQLTSAQIAEKVADDNMSSYNNVTKVLNHNGRVDKLGADYFPNIKKKEKLSIETIENAIYGERITPAPTVSEGKLSLEKLGQAFSENLKIDSFRNGEEINSIGESSNSIQRPPYEEIQESKELAHNDDDNRSLQNIDHELNENNTSPVSYTDSEPQYNMQAENFNNYIPNEQYAQDSKNYSDQPQYEAINQEHEYQEYDYGPPQDQQQTYEMSQHQNYESQENQNYDNQQTYPYPEHSEQNYAPAQYENYDQSYSNEYPEAEYAPSTQPQELMDQPQLQSVNNDYDYQQGTVTENSYDPNSQYYPDLQYNQENYQINPPQQYYEYQESDQIEENNYEDQPQVLSQIHELPPENLQAANSQLYESEVPSAETNEYQPQQSNPAFTEEAVHEVNQPGLQANQENLKMDTPVTLGSMEPTKPTSILAASDKTSESSPVTTKNKKKKRVIFAETESNPNQQPTTAKNESMMDQNESSTNPSK